MKETVVDARNGEHVKVPGKILKTAIREQINRLEQDLKDLLTRMNNETPNKETAIALMVALAGGGSLNQNGLFFKASVKRAAFIEEEIRDLNTIGMCFGDTNEVYYQITLDDARRYGLGL